MRYLAALMCLLVCSCGYRISGKADLLPTTVKTIAVPAFANATDRYKLTDVVPQAIADEFITRTRYKVVDAKGADAVLTGTILSARFNPTVFDPATGRASVAETHLVLQLKLVERATGKVLYNRPRLEVTQPYQISPTAIQYFDESDAAYQRASRQLASQVVTAILENF
jgi:hypothetical protein